MFFIKLHFFFKDFPLIFHGFQIKYLEASFIVYLGCKFSGQKKMPSLSSAQKNAICASHKNRTEHRTVWKKLTSAAFVGKHNSTGQPWVIKVAWDPWLFVL